jgi:hypothetical protein
MGAGGDHDFARAHLPEPLARQVAPGLRHYALEDADMVMPEDAEGRGAIQQADVCALFESGYRFVYPRGIPPPTAAPVGLLVDQHDARAAG